MKVRAKLTAVILFVALVPMAVIAWTTLSVHQDAYDAQREELQMTAARYGASLTSSELEDQRRGLSGIVQRSTPWASLSAAEREGATWLVYGQLDEIAAVTVTDGEGRVLEPPAFIAPGPTDRAWEDRGRLTLSAVHSLAADLPLAQAREHGTATSPVTFVGEAALLPLAFAVEGEGPNASPWVVGVVLSLEPACAEIVAQRPQRTRVSVFDDQGRRLCNAQAGDAEGTVSHAQIADIERGTITVDVEGAEILASVARTASGWSIVIEQPADEALAAGRSIRWQSLFWLALGVTGALLAGTILARGITGPLRRIEIAAHRVAEGDFEQQLDIKSEDELGDVARAFETMSREIRTWNEELVNRVDAKTRELRDAQDQLLQARKLSAMASLSAGVSHEINNPLTSVLAFSQILLASARRGEAPKRQIELLETLESEALRIRDIVQRMQALSQGPAGSGPLQLSGVLDAVSTRLTPQLEEHNVELARHDDDHVEDVLGNREQLEAVVENIVENAIKAMQGETRLLTMNLQSVGGELVVLEIGDTGRGISEEHLDRVFEPFFTTKDEWRGVGLGLSLAHRIVTDHRGTITIDSEVGEGTIFRVTLPALRTRAHLV